MVPVWHRARSFLCLMVLVLVLVVDLYRHISLVGIGPCHVCGVTLVFHVRGVTLVCHVRGVTLVCHVRVWHLSAGGRARCCQRCSLVVHAACNMQRVCSAPLCVQVSV
jgi:hypothetical protein